MKSDSALRREHERRRKPEAKQARACQRRLDKRASVTGERSGAADAVTGRPTS